MNRRGFLQRLGIALGVITAAPLIPTLPAAPTFAFHPDEIAMLTLTDYQHVYDERFRVGSVIRVRLPQRFCIVDDRA